MICHDLVRHRVSSMHALLCSSSVPEATYSYRAFPRTSFATRCWFAVQVAHPHRRKGRARTGRGARDMEKREMARRIGWAIVPSTERTTREKDRSSSSDRSRAERKKSMWREHRRCNVDHVVRPSRTMIIRMHACMTYPPAGYVCVFLFPGMTDSEGYLVVSHIASNNFSFPPGVRAPK